MTNQTSISKRFRELRERAGLSENNANWFGVVCACMAILAFLLTYKKANRTRFRRRATFTLIALILALPGVSFAVYYSHLLPEPSWYYEFRSWRGTEALLIPIGCAGGMAAALLPRWALIIPLFSTNA